MKHKGFTLVELMAALALVAILGIGVSRFESSEVNLYQQQKAAAALQFDAKIAVEQISKDIKNSRYTSFSVETNYVDNNNLTISNNQLSNGIFSTLNFGTTGTYAPIAYIDKFDGSSCMYAIKTLSNGTKELVREDLTSNEFTFDSQSVSTIYSYNSADYPTSQKLSLLNQNKILAGMQSSINISLVDFIYEENGSYYLINHDTLNHYQDKLIEQSCYVTNKNIEKVIARNVVSVSVCSIDMNIDRTMPTNAKNLAYNIDVSLRDSRLNLTREFIMCSSKVRYGGD